MAVGDIGSVIDTEEWKSTVVSQPFLSHATGTIYLALEAADPTVRSLSIDGAGNISAVIDSLSLGAVGGSYMQCVPIAGDVYAVSFLDATQVVVKTFTCDSSGNLGAAAIDTINISAKDVQGPHLIPSHKANIYIVAYTDSIGHGWLATIKINDDGSIDELLDSLQIEGSKGYFPWLINISSNVFAVILASGATLLSRIRTFTVSDAGALSLVDTYVFDSTGGSGQGGIILHVSGDVYAIFWQGADLDGWIYTLSITSAGAISTNIDTWEFVTSYCGKPKAMLASENQAANGQVFVVVYDQTGANEGQVFTVEILNNGTITESKIDTLTLVAANYATNLSIVSPGEGIYAACFRDLTGAGSGKIKSFPVEEVTVLLPMSGLNPALMEELMGY